MTANQDGREPSFEVARRGYRAPQVDVWVEETLRRIETLEAERDDARRQAASLQGSLDEMRGRETAPDTFGARAERILRMAEHDAHQRRERAESDAGDIRELAHSEAERTIAQARAEAARIRAEADQTFARARADLAAARRDADLRVDTAASMNEHVQSLRSAIRGEVARLHAALGAELRALDTPLPQETAPEPQAPPEVQKDVEPVSEPVSEPAGEPVSEPVSQTDGEPETEPDEPAAAVVALPVQRDHPPAEDATPASGMPATTAAESS